MTEPTQNEGFFYNSKYYTEEDLCRLSRDLRYRIKHSDRVRFKNKAYYESNREHLIQKNIDNYTIRKEFINLCKLSNI